MDVAQDSSGDPSFASVTSALELEGYVLLWETSGLASQYEVRKLAKDRAVSISPVRDKQCWPQQRDLLICQSHRQCAVLPSKTNLIAVRYQSIVLCI